MDILEDGAFGRGDMLGGHGAGRLQCAAAQAQATALKDVVGPPPSSQDA